jgi:hypothetical protein
VAGNSTRVHRRRQKKIGCAAIFRFSMFNVGIVALRGEVFVAKWNKLMHGPVASISARCRARSSAARSSRNRST